ncbi:hypothetical protein SDC9_149849 [bioreactor metagenome]|uniref:Uncharacterized protein n=1 Tax=bioreactor metagenome TaxID=1076179 RepID=A0A645EQ24_9ZZZZ
MAVHQRIDVVEKFQYLAILFKELNHRFIQSGYIIVPLIFPRIIDGAAIKYISASVAGRVVGNPFFVGETEYPDLKFALLGIGKLFQVNHFVQYSGQIRVFVETIFQQISEVVQCERDTLDEMRLLLEIAPESISTKYLKRPEQHEQPEFFYKLCFVNFPVLF